MSLANLTHERVCELCCLTAEQIHRLEALYKDGDAYLDRPPRERWWLSMHIWEAFNTAAIDVGGEYRSGGVWAFSRRDGSGYIFYDNGIWKG